jgi:hypothetical protein
MTETTTGAAETQADSVTQPPAGDSEAQAAEETGGSSPSEPMSLEDAKKLRQEANSLRKRLKAFEDAETQRAEAGKSEAERAAERIRALEGELESERSARRATILQLESVAAARKVGFRDPELAARLIATGDVEYGDDGRPKNVERLLTDLAKEYPNLVSAAADYGGGPRGAPVGGASDMNARIRRAAGRA